MALGKTRRGLGAALAALGLNLALAGAAGAEPPLTGSFGKRFQLQEAPLRAPAAEFRTRAGETVSLRDYADKVLLVNFWATWCPPCVEEMPTLDALAAEMNSDRFKVMAVSTDRGGANTVDEFLEKKMTLDTLDIYLAPDAKLARAFGVKGMPTTYLVDTGGAVVGYLQGAADWNSTSVKKLIRYYVEQARDEAASG